MLDDPGRPPGAGRSGCAPRRSWALDAETSSLQPHDAELVGLSLAASPTEVWYLPFGHRPRRRRAGRARRRSRNLPPIGDFCLAPLVALLAGSGGPQGRPQHQVRLAGAPPRRRRAGRRGVRLDARELRPRSRPPLARHRHALPRALRPHAADLRRPHRARARRRSRSPRCAIAAAAAYCGADSARRARAARATSRPALARDGDGAAAPRHRAAAGAGADRHGVGGDLDRSGRCSRGSTPSSAATSAGSRARSPPWRARRSTSIRPASSRPSCSRSSSSRCSSGPRAGPSTDADVLEQLAAMGHALPAADPRLPRAAEAQEHLRRHPAGHGQPPDRPHPHQLQPDRRRHRAAELVRSQPAEHPDPDAARRGDPARVRPARRLAVPGGRLLADRAAPHGAPLGRPRVHRSVPPGRRHPPPDRRADLRRRRSTR